MTITQSVSDICSHHCTGNCHKESCPRGSWYEPEFEVHIPRVSEKNTKCPLLQFDAKKTAGTKGLFGYRSELTESDTWKICRKCMYGGKGSISETCYEQHCLDCPNLMIRDGLQESRILAIIS